MSRQPPITLGDPESEQGDGAPDPKQPTYLEILTYRPGKENVIADILSRKQEELKTQKAKYEASRMATLIDPAIAVAPVNARENTATPTKGPAPTTPGPDPTNSPNQPPTTTSDKDPIPPQTPPEAPYQVVDQILQANRTSESLQAYRKLAEQGKDYWQLTDGLLTRHGKLMVPDEGTLRTQLIELVHAYQVTAHPGIEKTRQLLAAQYYWPSLTSDTSRYVRNCGTCRRTHIPRDRAPGLLHPLPIPEHCWQHISFDFKSFPKDKKGYDSAFVVVDRLSKRAFTLPCKKTTSAKDAADLYYKHIWRVYGLPETATSDRGGQFVSAFTNELCKLTGVKQKLSTAYHPQTDGNTEVLNQYIDQRLRPFVNHFQDDWSDLLPCIDFAQAILPHSSTGYAPYELELGHKPRLHFDWEERTRQASTPRETLTRREAQAFASRTHKAVEWARKNLAIAQDRQAKQANKHRREPDFKVGDKVYIVRKGWTSDRPSIKLDNQLAGPYPIVAMKGHSYVIDLPQHMKMDNVFHADRLRKDPQDPLPGQKKEPEEPIEINGEKEWTVEKILSSRVRNGVLQYKVDWQGYDPDDTFYDASGFIGAPHKVQAFHEKYPNAPGPPARLQDWLNAYI